MLCISNFESIFIVSKFFEVNSSLIHCIVKLSPKTPFGLLSNCSLWSYLSWLRSVKQKQKPKNHKKKVQNGKLDAIKIHLGATSLCAAPNCRQVLYVCWVGKFCDTLAAH